MKCPKCQVENSEGVKFCGECGHKFSDVALFAGLLLAPSVSFTLEMAAIILILLASYLGSLSKAAGGLRQYGGVMGKADPMALVYRRCLQISLRCNEPSFNSQEGG